VVLVIIKYTISVLRCFSVTLGDDMFFFITAGGSDRHIYYYFDCWVLFITAGMVVERKPCVRGKMSEKAMRRSKATACML
jgi:hypothetical protein